MNPISRYLLRRERLLKVLRGLRGRRQLSRVSVRVGSAAPDTIMLFATLRNERIRLPYFLEYYRAMGVGHFCFVDNGSTDGSREYLSWQTDCSVWATDTSYKKAGFGMDWLNGLMRRNALGHWVLVVDIDEFFVYPHMNTRPLRALTDWLDTRNIPSFGATLLDMYPKKSITEKPYAEGANPFEYLSWFDGGNYIVSRNPRYGNLWIQGGVRQRAFFPDNPYNSPALNKIPLVKWQKGQVFVSSTHALLPRNLNVVYSEEGGERASGCLLHAKFLDLFTEKATEEAQRLQHYAASREYRAYLKNLTGDASMWTEHSERYEDWQQLESLGLMSRGGWA